MISHSRKQVSLLYSPFLHTHTLSTAYSFMVHINASDLSVLKVNAMT